MCVCVGRVQARTPPAYHRMQIITLFFTSRTLYLSISIYLSISVRDWPRCFTCRFNIISHATTAFKGLREVACETTWTVATEPRCGARPASQTGRANTRRDPPFAATPRTRPACTPCFFARFAQRPPASQDATPTRSRRQVSLRHAMV